MRLTATLAAILVVACATPAPPPPASVPQDDARAIHETLLGWYQAIHSFDSAGIASPLTPTFLILEDTLPLSREALVAGILSGRGMGSQTAELRDLKTRVNGDVAWTTLRNHEVFTSVSGKTDTLDFLETIVFERVAGRWMIDRYHAARLNRPAPAPTGPR